MSRAMSLELQELALSACYVPGIPAGLIHRGIFVHSPKKNISLARRTLQGPSEMSEPESVGA